MNNHIRIRIALVLAIFGGMLACASILMARAHADNWTPEQWAYLNTLHDAGYNSGLGDAGMLKAGYATCSLLDSGLTESSVIRKLYAGNDGLEESDAAYIVGAAEGALCPEQIGHWS